MTIKKQVFLGLLLAIAVAVGYMETMIPLPIAMHALDYRTPLF